MAKSATAKTKKTSRATPRRLKQPQYKTMRLQKRVTHPVKLPNVWHITKTTAQLFWQHKRLFIGIGLVYGALNLILSQTVIGATDVSGLKQDLNSFLTGNWGALTSSLSIFVVLVSSAGSSASASGGAYAMLLALIVSLAIIWSLRQVMAGKQVTVKTAYYRGMYPLVPFILVLLVIGLQLLPLLIGSSLYNLVSNNGVAVYPIERLLWAMLYGLSALLSLYMLSSSLFALYIVTLSDMTPLAALRSARELVRFRRWTVLRKILFLPLLLLVVAAVIMLPIILWLTPLAQWVFFALTTFVIVAVHGYMYVLYRELLNE